MSLSPGARLGAYEIESLRGTGGMGEVYRARDTRLDRTVALKVLPAHVAGDPVRRQRFEREARAISQLSHPHICALYDVGEVPGASLPSGGSDGAADPATPATVPFLVMEYLEGQTLAERLKRGPLPVGDAVQYATQIADALDAAHRRGIVHRDLKPGNVMLTKAGAKLLDFGLARTPARQLDSAMVTDMPSTLTGEGVILGTLPYMAPELLEGGEADARSDVFAFGAVLYEMLTGRRAFAGDSQSAVVAAILDSQPAALPTGPAAAPPALAHLVTTCLDKDRDERWQSAGDLRRQLEWIAASGRDAGGAPGAAEPRRGGSWLWPATAVLLLLAGLGLSSMLSGERPSPPARVSFQVSPPAGAAFADSNFALSPDGRSLAYVASSADGSGRHLWIHSFETGDPRVLMAAGAGVGGPIVWSPDGRFLAFPSDGKLKRIAVAGGSAQTVTDGAMGVSAWSTDDVVLYIDRRLVAMRVAAGGGTAMALTTLDASRHEIAHYFHRLLPDGRHFLYLRQSLAEETSGIYIGSVDAKPEEQDLTRLIATRGVADYAPSSDDPRVGHVPFNREDTLLAQRFDADARELKGDAVPLAERLATVDNPSRAGIFSVSATGVLAYRQAVVAAGTPVWVSRDGTELMPVVNASLPDPGQVRLSPDGTRLAVIVDGDIWVYDVSGRPPVKLTTGGGIDMPLWTPDSHEIVYARTRPPFRLFSIRADVGSAPAPVSPLGHYHPHGWSTDGRYLVTAVNSYSPTGYDVLKIPWRNGIPEPLARTSSADGMYGAAMSPDGQWLAYTLNVTGSHQVWVRPYSGPGAPVPVSANGGVNPQWARNGRELYFVEGGNRLMAVDVRPGPAFDFTPPRLLFESSFPFAPFPNSSYDVAADGRFLVIRPARPSAPPPITVVLNWAAGLTGDSR